jgi:hypothetical protein
MNGARRAMAVAFSALVSACAASAGRRQPLGPTPTCAAPATAQRQITLYFGRGWRGGEVSDAEWTGFVADAVAPRFPNGFTVWDATGQWRDSAGVVVHERSKVVRLVTDDPVGARVAAAAIANEYRRRFEQEAVLETEADVCASL